MTLIVIAAIAIMALLAWISYKSKQQLREKGLIITREAKFYQKKQIIRTTASFEDIAKKLKEADLNQAGASAKYGVGDNKAILFDSQQFKWTAILEQTEQSDKNIFEFAFTKWQTQNGMVVSADSMNVLLTYIEKAFLALDQTTTIESQAQQIKSKTSFF